MVVFLYYENGVFIHAHVVRRQLPVYLYRSLPYVKTILILDRESVLL
jgi:hypothetical protein